MRFVRTAGFESRLAMGHSKFHEERNAGRIPEPDAWLGPRSPVWLEETVEQTIKAYLAAPRPIETRPLRRRRKEAAE
jgi:predicted DNA-binding transcriptional regulator AlpA